MLSISAEQLNQSLESHLWPRFDLVECQDNIVTINAFVPDNLDYFAGHFPDQAVLPGVVQVHWVGELAKRFFAVSGFSELKSIKFSSMVLPNQDIELTLKYLQDKGTVRFSYHSKADQTEALKFSSGMLSFSVQSAGSGAES
jgi:3-hydroxymyristoyl/3-hydroxydecanoyl-(acyl carrier protein) dehydratase